MNTERLNGRQFVEICNRYGYTIEIEHISFLYARLVGTACRDVKTPYPRTLKTKILSLEFCKKIFNTNKK